MYSTGNTANIFTFFPIFYNNYKSNITFKNCDYVVRLQFIYDSSTSQLKKKECLPKESEKSYNF